jgi:hypothetical protein
MFKKLETINKTPTFLSYRKCKPSFEFKDKIKDGGLTREQRLQIEAGNKYYKGKLSRQGSYYSLSKWKKDFELSQHFKKNICEFPCIDFYKIRRDLEDKDKGLNSVKNMKFFNLFSNNSYNYFNNTRFKPILKNNEKMALSTEDEVEAEKYLEMKEKEKEKEKEKGKEKEKKKAKKKEKEQEKENEKV